MTCRIHRGGVTRYAPSAEYDVWRTIHRAGRQFTVRSAATEVRRSTLKACATHLWWGKRILLHYRRAGRSARRRSRTCPTPKCRNKGKLSDIALKPCAAGSRTGRTEAARCNEMRQAPRRLSARQTRVSAPRRSARPEAWAADLAILWRTLHRAGGLFTIRFPATEVAAAR